ncbi:MAG TPA: hypothetical protein VF406_20085 [Thermodesulfobacteriota bacterium]
MSGRTVRVWLVAGVAGLAATLLGALADPRQAAFSYLTAFAFATTLAVGALLFVMIAHVAGGAWFVTLRRLTETVAATLPALALLALPVLVAMPALYPWVPPLDGLAPHLRELVRHKAPYLNVPFFVIRTVAYFAIWIGVGACLRRWSAAQDGGGDAAALVARQRRLSGGGLPFVALALTFAAFDWLMSLEPEWYSTIYGIYVFAGGFVGAIALVTVLARRAERARRLEGLVTVEHYHALGKLLLTFVIFWAYIAYAQFFIIWIGDVPEDVSWYALRLRGSWGAVAGALAVGHFALPFAALLSWRLKRRPAALGAVAWWLIALHYLDVYWLVVPTLHPDGARPHWLDLAALAGVVGVAVAFGGWRLRGVALVPASDPSLAAALRFETS